MGVSQSLRFQVFERDGFRCQYCGKKAPEVNLVADHVVPVSAGGTDDPENLISACADCNNGKGARILREPTSNEDIKKRLKQLKERRFLLEKCTDNLREIIISKNRVEWHLLERILRPMGKWKTGKDDVNEASWYLACYIRGAMTKHTAEEILDAIDITMNRHRESSETTIIKYLCGVLRAKACEREDLQ